jgi:hypothetical protein
MEAATEVGSQQVVLGECVLSCWAWPTLLWFCNVLSRIAGTAEHTGDRPSDVSQRRLAAAITAASGSRLVAALGVLLAGIVTATAHVLPDVEAAAATLTGSAATADASLVGAAAAASLALAWPVLAPFVEVWRFSQLSGEELEEVVAIKEPLQVRTGGTRSSSRRCCSPCTWRLLLSACRTGLLLNTLRRLTFLCVRAQSPHHLQANLDRPFYVWGEDALLSWPGAEPALIQERDAFMARVLAATATSANCNAPAFVAEEVRCAGGKLGCGVALRVLLNVRPLHWQGPCRACLRRGRADLNQRRPHHAHPQDDEGQLVWRYLMPEGASAPSAPKGGGDGAFEPLQGPEAVVAVVGSAHVRGMVKAWQDSLAKPGAVDDLLGVE